MISSCPHYNVPYRVYKNSEKSMESADETRSFEKGKVEIAKVGETTIGRALVLNREGVGKNA